MQSVENNKGIAKKVAMSGMLVALAMIFSYVEAIIPFSVGIPGIKLGLANLVILGCLYLMNPFHVLMILIVRIVLSGFLFGNLSVIIYSLAGGLLSFAVMFAFKRIKFFSILGVSIIGGVTHNVGQIVVAIIVVENLSILAYLPVLLISGSMAGAVIGLISKRINPILKKALS